MDLTQINVVWIIRSDARLGCDLFNQNYCFLLELVFCLSNAMQ